MSRVRFVGNGFTTRETAQVYWLNRCAELAADKGFAGFEILSDIHFVMQRPTLDDRIGRPLDSSLAYLRTRIPVSADEVAGLAIWRDQGEFASRSAEPIRVAHGGAVFIYGGGGGSAPRTVIESDVHFIAGPVESAPPKIFNAKALRAQLEPLLKAEKCGTGNLCPHVHEYLLPKGTLR